MKNRTRAERRALTGRVVTRRKKLLLRWRPTWYAHPVNLVSRWSKGPVEWGYAHFIRQGNRLSKWNLTYLNSSRASVHSRTMSHAHVLDLVLDADDVAEMLTSAQYHKVTHPGQMGDPWTWD
jgi:hypothetical protein